MLKFSRRAIASASVLVFVATACFAQQRGGGQFGQMREKYKYTFQLMTMVRHIGDIDKDRKYALSPVQAKRVLGVLQPLRSKPKLSQDQAKQALKSLKPVFTVNQLNAMARIKPRPQGQRGMGQGRQGGGGPGGPGGNRAGRQRMDPNAMKDFNPFYAKAPAGGFGARGAKRFNDLFTTLQKRAKGQSQASPRGAKPAPSRGK